MKFRRVIKEQFIPEFAIRQISDACADDVKRLIINHINSNTTSQAERQQMLGQMNIIMEDLQDEIKKLLDSKVNEFFNRSI
jgi:hypothetical protein